MEERHKQINALITKIALGNPNITQEQITRARTMYSGDTRPLEEIERELLEYSAYISSTPKTTVPEKQSVLTSKEDKMVEELSLEKTMPIPSIIPVVEEKKEEDEMAKMFEEYQGQSEIQPTLTTSQEKEIPKQLIKTQTNEKGYGNVSGLLTIAAILSIMTVIMAIFTIITN